MSGKRLVENIRRLCARKGISMTRMEQDLGFSPGLISRWSRTKTSPAFDKIAAIVKYLHISYEELLEDVMEEETGEEQADFRETSSKREWDFSTEERQGFSSEDFLEVLTTLTENGEVLWKPGEEVDVDFPIEEMVDIRNYSRHEWYFLAHDANYCVLVVQYNKRNHNVHMALYFVVSPFCEPVREKIENSKYYGRILRCVDEEFYREIQKAKIQAAKEDFMRKASGF